MLWAIYCIDKPNTAAIREGYMHPHRRYPDSKQDILVLAGAMLADNGVEATGSLFIINVNSRTEARAFSDGDPFTQAGVFAGVTITRMRKSQWNPPAAQGA